MNEAEERALHAAYQTVEKLHAPRKDYVRTVGWWRTRKKDSLEYIRTLWHRPEPVRPRPKRKENE